MFCDIKMLKKKSFGCVDCGHSFTADPPDDYHPTASRNEKEFKDAIKMTYICDNPECKKPQVLYWGRKPMMVLRG